MSDQRADDREAIRDRLARWCRAIDRKDLEAIRDAYHPDAYDNHGAYSGDVDGFIEWFSKRHEDIPFSFHMLGQTVIDFDGDAAAVETYVWLVQSYPSTTSSALRQFTESDAPEAGDGPVEFITCGRYVDRFEKRHGEWRIARRTIVTGPKLIQRSLPLGETPGWVADRRDRQDRIYVEIDRLMTAGKTETA